MVLSNGVKYLPRCAESTPKLLIVTAVSILFSPCCSICMDNASSIMGFSFRDTTLCIQYGSKILHQISSFQTAFAKDQLARRKTVSIVMRKKCLLFTIFVAQVANLMN